MSLIENSAGLGGRIRYFLGANTPTGFVGYTDDLYDCRGGWRAFLIKSGPGTGKNTLMRAVLEAMTAHGEEAQTICCSSDPHSLDAILFDRLKLALIDATAPHIIEPKYWGAVEEIVDLGSCMDNTRMHEHADAVIELTDACSALHARCRKFLCAAASLLGDSRRIAQGCTDFPKIARTAARIGAREFGPPAEKAGREQRRFLSAVTPEGLVVFHETLQLQCPRIYTIEDEYGAAARELLVDLRRRALEAGHDCITCACPLAPYDKIEHLVIPELGLAFTTSNCWHKADFPVYRRIHAARFTDAETLRMKKQVMSFNRRAARELLAEAVRTAEEAKAVHDRMEDFSRAAMDWDKAAALTRQVVDTFTGIAEAAK